LNEDDVNTIPLLLYVAAGILYGSFFTTRRAAVGRASTAVLAAGALSHTFVIGMQTMAAGHVPITGTTQAISTFVWLLALAYLYLEMTTDERALGVFIVPLLVALQAVRAFNPVVEKRVPILESPWFGVHVASLLFAYASFALACVIGITYVLLFKEIKAKHLGFFYKRLPSLDSLDLMNARTVTIGWIFLTVGVVVGAIWADQARRGPVVDPRIQAMSLADPKILATLVCWAIYTFALYTRRLGWGGKRAAYFSAVGFAIVLFNFVPIGYFLTRSHNFGG
jgi:ABC-type transport system involved in cytochrome c biogenesis permease subunit